MSYLQIPKISGGTHKKWSEWQNNPITEETYREWKDKDRYSNGMALIPGKVWRGTDSGKFLVFIDLDNQKDIDEVCHSFDCSSLEHLSEYLIVEQHKDNKTKVHLYLYSDHIFTKKSSDAAKMKDGITNNEVPAIEVKGLGEHGIVFCSPSFHKEGQRYEKIRTMDTKTYGKEVEDTLFQIYKKHGLGIDNEGKVLTKELFNADFKIHKGHNRHEALLRIMESLIRRKMPIYSLEQIKNEAIEWNNVHCIPPRDGKEVEKQWTDELDEINKEDSNQSVIYSSKINNIYITKKINDDPDVFYYADLVNKKIGGFKIVLIEDKETGEKKEKKIFSNRSSIEISEL